MHEANPGKTARKAFSSTSSSRRSSNGCASGHDVEEDEEEQLYQEASSSAGTNSVDGSGFNPFTAAVSATPVTDFYSNATVLITGGTGFVGKVLTEKLLRSFGLRKIYMLIRSKDSLSVQERLKGFFNESIFNRMREESPQLLAKVHPIRADYSAIDLDIDSADRAMLSSEVQIVFNVVASVKFNEKLSDAIDINVLGTKKILDLAMEMKHLKSFVHISTLYCNCNRKFIKEQVYENEIGYEKIMQIYRTFDDETLEKMRHCLIGQMPNTYTMTKKCAENLVNHRAFHMPAGIFRPPIDLSSAKVKWMAKRSCPYTTTCPMRTT
ncbi:putative fatty acyl-CoA reductase CG5065 isoform X2 [Drosophila teissieri]|uniref:putative fatty acyl-CoA reductase CG5065 isoform X2 n=1 Tax=Drosophila teissieri TaxID=7243 RepID=UPI001CBA4B4E|nr:putative fatty acyl-CoA reductase CG5065 isoform X2 [Drosophila teissieri]